MKRKWIGCLVAAMIVVLSACGNGSTPEKVSTTDEGRQEITEKPADSMASGDSEGDTISERENTGKLLVAYFTRLPNTESGDDLDVVVQGGGPYGAIGDDFENADMDAISSASITVTDAGAKGNVETVAEWVAEYTGADLFSIETVEKYPVDYDALIEQGGEEHRRQYRPELTTHIENINQYSVIYLGYPNWYHDMPMALYSFLEEYDLQGKTIIPFATSAGSGLANTISSIADMEPEAVVVKEGLSLGMEDVKDSRKRVMEWVDSLGTRDIIN